VIAWNVVAPALRTLFSDLALATAANPAFLALWRDGNAEFTHPDVQRTLTLRVTRISDVDGARQYVTNDDDELEEHIVGMREFTLEVRVRSHEHAEDQAAWAWSMLERIRTGLYFTRAINALLAVNVGIVRIGDSRDVSYRYDKRRINAAMFEVTFNAGFDLQDVSAAANWFDTVLLTTAIKRPDGTLLPTPPNLDEFEISVSEED
jgi:hypothetical protein